MPFALRIAALNHEVGDDTVEGQAVEEALLDQRYETPRGFGACAVSSVVTMQPRLVWMFAVVPLPAGAADVAVGVVVGLEPDDLLLPPQAATASMRDAIRTTATRDMGGERR